MSVKSGVRATGSPASRLIEGRIRLGDWREKALARMRALILEADPEIIEDRKWRKPPNGMTGSRVWSHNGIICTGETYRNVVKLTFARGADLPDSSRLFTEAQRQRFVEVFLEAADEAGLPNDERFRRRFRECLERGSRIATEISQPGSDITTREPLPAVGRGLDSAGEYAEEQSPAGSQT